MSSMIVCPECNGARLKKESLCFRIADKNIGELSAHGYQGIVGIP